VEAPKPVATAQAASPAVSAELLTPTRAKLLASYVTRDLLKLSPEQAIARFAGIVPLARKEPVPEGALLQGSVDGDKLELSYDLTAKGKLYCSVATLRFAVASSEEASLLYKRVEAELRRQLGKPTSSIGTDHPHPTLAWKLVRRVELTLGEIPADESLGVGHQLELMIGEPTGEAE
jgi:hypothetical protein